MTISDYQHSSAERFKDITSEMLVNATGIIKSKGETKKVATTAGLNGRISADKNTTSLQRGL